jgi:AraC family transcriptional regulator of adaptative response / DNA-3-methyladenine glycosylase II
VVALSPGAGAVRCRLRLEDPADRDAAVACCRRLLDLDADPAPIVERLGRDPLLGGLVRRRPGLRVPRCVDGFELAVRAVVGQQITVAAARTVLGRLCAEYGRPLSGAARGGVTHRFPGPAALAQVDPEELPFPRGRGEALRALARLVADGALRLGECADPRAAQSTLLGIRGIGPWTAAYISMRALGDDDAWPPGDVGVRNALARLGLRADDGASAELAEGWRPWRSYAVMHLWGSLGRTVSPSRA